MPNPVGPAVDPIVVSVVQHRLLAIVEEMGEAMLRTAYSQILNSSRDFSTAICDLDGLQHFLRRRAAQRRVGVARPAESKHRVRPRIDVARGNRHAKLRQKDRKSVV